MQNYIENERKKYPPNSLIETASELSNAEEKSEVVKIKMDVAENKTKKELLTSKLDRLSFSSNLVSNFNLINFKLQELDFLI